MVPSGISYLNQSRGASGAVGEPPPGCGTAPTAAAYVWGANLPGDEQTTAESQNGTSTSSRGVAGKVHWEAAPFLTDPRTEVKYRVALHSTLEEASGLP